ncbi:hypothetical protein N0V88_006548 [Collariella sp. IMI 366227]|nr:hypothetical protein N0V88_006548 [Collariella sp. IMI 366227]
MAPSSIAAFNPFNPLCVASPCLEQVIGHVDNRPIAQFEACASMFGAPATSTVYAAANIVFFTTTLTIPYTDIIVPVSTAFSTKTVTSTSYTEVLEVVTKYSSTRIATVTTVVAPPTQPTKRAVRRRGKCGGPKTSSTTSSVSTTSSITPSGPTPVASGCLNVKQYSSACSCIYAVSSTAIVTEPASTSTSVVTITETSTIPVTSTSVITVVVSSTVVEPATSTVTSTLTTLFETTTTVTSTATPSPTLNPQRVQNPGFEQLSQGWTTRATDARLVYTGTGGLQPFVSVSQTLTGLRVGAKYTAAAWFKVPPVGGGNPGCIVRLEIDGVVVLRSMTIGADWAQLVNVYTAAKETAELVISQTCPANGLVRITWVDDVTVTLQV